MKGLEVKAGFWALFDQGAVSLGNFLTQMLLARNLSWSDYGVFALIYGVLFFLVNSVGSMVTYPLSVKGASTDADGLRGLAGASLWFDMGLVLPAALIILGATAALHRLGLFTFVLAALVFWQFQETLRRALMARLGHRDAAWGDGLSYLGQAVWIGVLARTGGLTLQSAFLAIVVTSAVAALVQAIQVRPRLGGIAEVQSLLREYWRLGGWASSTNLMNGATQQAFPWALGLLFGTAEAGSFQAVVNPLKIFNPLIAGLQNLIVPAVAKAQREQGIRAASRNGMTYATIGSVIFFPCLLAIVIWPHAVLGVLYGFHSPYARLELAVRVCALAFAFGYWAEVIGSLLNGLAVPKSSFLAQTGGTAASVLVGVPLTLREGLLGALAGLMICAAIKAGISVYVVRTRIRLERLRATMERSVLW